MTAGSHGRVIEALFAWSQVWPGDSATSDAVDWLMECGQPVMEHEHYHGLFFRARRADLAEVRETPFTPGCTGFIKTGAALFFSCVLEQGCPQRRRRAFGSLRALPAHREGRWCSASCSNNILQAFAASVVHRESEPMALVIDRLAQDQGSNGVFAGGVPFYPTLYALAQLPQTRGREVLTQAVGAAIRRQRGDGSWAGVGATYLALDALDRVGVFSGAARR